jgi:hypothetical protein
VFSQLNLQSVYPADLLRKRRDGHSEFRFRDLSFGYKSGHVTRYAPPTTQTLPKLTMPSKQVHFGRNQLYSPPSPSNVPLPLPRRHASMKPAKPAIHYPPPAPAERHRPHRSNSLPASHHHHYRIHQMLANMYPLHFDIRQSPSAIMVSRHQLDESATYPPVASMTLTSSRLPWSIRAKPVSNGVHVTVRDVLEAVYASTRQSVSQTEYYTLLPQERHRHRVSAAYDSRWRHTQGWKYQHREKAEGLKRVDFFMEETRVHGISRGDHGVWIINTSR